MSFKGYILLLFSFFVSYLSFSQDYSPAEFIENKGQWDKSVKYMVQVPAGALYVHNNGITVLQHDAIDWQKVQDVIHGHKDDKIPMPKDAKVRIHSHAYHIQFLNALASSQITADKPIEGYNNYFIGNDPSKWGSHCRIYQGVTIKNIYRNIDLRYYSNNGQLKYDLIVNPGANINDIALKYDGVNSLNVTNKELVVGTSVGNIKELRPYSYQYTSTEKKEININYDVKGNVVKFKVKNYDPATTLIIDPTLVFVSFSGSQATTWGYTATYGPDGSLFGGGIVFSEGFPTTTGSFQQDWSNSGSNGFDMGIVKLNARGSKRLYATYIGGSGNEQPHSLFCDPQGNLVIAGRSNSPNYPTTGSGVIGAGGGFDIVITKLSADGSSLIGSKRIGGTGDDGMNIDQGHKQAQSLEENYGDDARSEVILDGSGNIYLASCTRSGGAANSAEAFPTTANAFQNTLKGSQDAVVIKLDPNVTTLLYSTYLGGSKNDAAYVIALNPFDGLAYVAGGTESDSLPGVKSGPTGNFNGDIDGFVSVINTNGGAPSTVYIGTAAKDQIYGIQFDKFGYPYVMGQTMSSAWPIKKPANATSFYVDAGGKQFIAKLEKDLSSFVYSTVFGSGATYPDISPTAFLVDRCENIYVSGWGGQIEGFKSAGTSGLQSKVKNSVVKNHTDGNDFFFFVLQRDAASQLYGDFFGQDGGFTDHVDGGTSRFDKNGVIYQAICANCNEAPRPIFPTTPGSAEPVNRSKFCDLALIKVSFNFSGVHAGVQASINGVVNDTAGCVPLKIDFYDTLQNAKSYEWDFGDGSARLPTTDPRVSHTYTNTGNYRVMLIAIDPTTCNLRDTSYIHVRVGNNQATPAFTSERLLPCGSFKYRFTNTSVAPNGPAFSNNAFVWDFGDNTPRVTTGNGFVEHQYIAPGTYKVKLILVDTAYCNGPDSAVQDIRISPKLKAQFEAPLAGCAPSQVIFKNTSTSGQTFVWNFGDGSAPVTISDAMVSHLYTTPGTYTVTLVATEPQPCFVQDSATASITIYNKPKADFVPSPQPPSLNTPITFTNLSTNATSYKWLFGDGDSLVTTSTQPFSHDYNATGTYNTCLLATNASGCTDTICKPVQVIVSTSIDVPNAFTPLSGDVNSRIGVRGYGISKMTFAIWNRWGQKMFETNSRREGWDGRYKGVLQPMDVYAYTLSVEFTDGKKLNKRGDITLIR